jgi:protocatechuate 3,4-dioxygenase beta subunit
MILGSAATLAGMTWTQPVAAANPILRTPGQVEGPYWVDNMPFRSNIRSSNGTTQPGMSMRLGINVQGLFNNVLTPILNARVDVWHCNATGVFSANAGQGTLGQDFLRGYLFTDPCGNAVFETIYPGWIPNRTPHLYLRVRLYSGAILVYNFVTQLYFVESITQQVYQTQPYSSRPGPDTLNYGDLIFLGASFGPGLAVPKHSGTYTILTLAKRAQSRVLAFFNVVL